MANFKPTGRTGMKIVTCMNSDPENSKWGEYAPLGGCDEQIEVDEKSERALCWRCTSRAVNMQPTFERED